MEPVLIHSFCVCISVCIYACACVLVYVCVCLYLHTDLGAGSCVGHKPFILGCSDDVIKRPEIYQVFAL